MENKIASLDSIFHALADPTRRAVVQTLMKGSAKVSDLHAPFDMGLPSFMKHISVLENAGLLASEKTGRVRSCSLNASGLAAAERWFEDQRQVWQSRYDQLDSLLASFTGPPHDT